MEEFGEKFKFKKIEREFTYENPCEYCGFPVEIKGEHHPTCPNYSEKGEGEEMVTEEEKIKETLEEMMRRAEEYEEIMGLEEKGEKEKKTEKEEEKKSLTKEEEPATQLIISKKIESTLNILDTALREINQFTFGGGKRISRWDENKINISKKFFDDKWEESTRGLKFIDLLKILEKLEKDYFGTPAEKILKTWKEKKFIPIKEIKKVR